MKIKKGNRSPFSLLRLEDGGMVGYRVRFDESCAYDIGKDQHKINRLFGIGYFQKRDSVSFGWRYSHGMVELMALWYLNGIRYADRIKNLDLGREYILKIHLLRDWHALTVADDLTMRGTTSLNIPLGGKHLGYLLRPKFCTRAPHTIEIGMERI